MSVKMLRELASKDARLTSLLNNAQTPEALASIARDAGVSIDLDDLDSSDEEISDDELATVTGGMRGVSGGGLRMKSFMFNADGAHTCNTSTCTECSNCGAHTCNTSTCTECRNCDSSGSSGVKMSFY